jgi:hypothetical protein
LAYLDVDFVLPIAVLAASIVGVVLVRLAAARGERAARIRTERLIQRHTRISTPAALNSECRVQPHVGMSDTDRASIE